MASVIAAGTTAGTALNFSGDTSGSLQLQTNGTTTAVTISTAQVVTLAQPLPVASGGSGVTTSTGTGANVLGTSPTLTTPVINGFTGDTSVINIGSGQVYKDASGNVGIGTSSPAYPLTLGNNKQFGALNTAGAAVPLAILNGSNNLIFGDDSVNTGTLTIQSRGNTLFSLNGSEQMRIDSTGLLKFNSGYGSVATAYGCRAWVNFNGTGTVAIRASGNVSSITDNGTGDYTVNFTTAMPDANYVGVGQGSQVTTATTFQIENTARTANAYRFYTISFPGAATDGLYVSMAFFR